MNRRSLCLASVLSPLAFSLSAGATEESSSEPFLRYDLRLSGREARRCLLLVPRAARGAIPLLIALHGQGEAGSERLAMIAWSERYGLLSAHERLLHPPIAPTQPKLGYFTDESLSALNRSLQRRPFQPIAVACPVTPKPWGADGPNVIARYADWLEQVLLPAVREKIPVGALGLDGCSMGGNVGLKVFLRRPATYQSFGMVQGAVKRANAPRYAKDLANAIWRCGPVPIHLLTSTYDVYRHAHEILAEQLQQLEVPNTLVVPEGHHNQSWLREIGSLLMLLWHSRILHGFPVRP